MKERALALSIRELKEKCEGVLSNVVADSLATPQEIAAWQPGGMANRDTTIRGWLQYLRMLDRWHAKGSVRAAPADEDAKARAEDLTQRTLAREPIVVKLSPEADGTPRTMAVFPKSFSALVHIDMRDRLLQYLAEAADRRIRAGTGTPDDTAALARVLDEISYQHSVIAWSVCHPAPGLPFGAGKVRPEVPAEYTALDPIEIVLLMRGHREVNAERLAALQHLITPDTKDEARRPSWTSFISSLASAKSIADDVLMNDWSLTGMLASNAIAASDARELLKQAEKAA